MKTFRDAIHGIMHPTHVKNVLDGHTWSHAFRPRRRLSSEHHLPRDRPRLKITYQVLSLTRGSHFHMTADEVGTRGGHLLEIV